MATKVYALVPTSDPMSIGSSNVSSVASPRGMLSSLLVTVGGASMSASTSVTIALTVCIVLLSTRIYCARLNLESEGKCGARFAKMLPYWLPVIGHSLQLLYDPVAFMKEAGLSSAHGIFAINLGATTHTIITSPGLIKSAFQQKDSSLQFKAIEWLVLERFFGIRHGMKDVYYMNWEGLMSCMTNTLMREPSLTNILRPTIRGLEENISNMITFMGSPIDQQPWEVASKALVVSGCSEDVVTEIYLMSLMRDMMGHVSVPALFGKAFSENFPTVLRDLYAMDYGLQWFLAGVPSWVPIPAAVRAHTARKRVQASMTAFHIALDAAADGNEDPAWGSMEDVSEAIRGRHSIYRDNNFAPEDRGDIAILWAMIVNANLLVYWQLHHILATPDLVERIRKEIAPYARVIRPAVIGGISEAPKLEIDHESLSRKCPLLRSTYIEALRISSRPWSIRKVVKDVVITSDKRDTTSTASYSLRKGEYVTMPHDVHMRDPECYKNPDVFDPERFLTRNEDGTCTADMGTVRPYGGGPSMCKGRVFAERECLSLVSGVLAMWDIEMPDGKEWSIPGQVKTTAVSLPTCDTRVRIKRRKFDWDY